jgi:hypothetical protein
LLVAGPLVTWPLPELSQTAKTSEGYSTTKNTTERQKNPAKLAFNTQIAVHKVFMAGLAEKHVVRRRTLGVVGTEQWRIRADAIAAVAQALDGGYRKIVDVKSVACKHGYRSRPHTRIARPAPADRS